MIENDLELIADIFSASSQDSLLSRLLKRVTELVSADHAALFRLDRYSGLVKIKAVHRLPHDLIGSKTHANLGLVGKALESMRPQEIPDGDNWEWDPFGDSHTPHHALAYPLPIDEHSAAALYLIWDKPYPSEQAISAIDRMAPVLQLATENADMSERARDYESLLQAFATLYGTLSDLVEAPTLTEVYDRIWDYWKHEADYGSLWLLSPPLSEPQERSNLVAKARWGKLPTEPSTGELTISKETADELRSISEIHPLPLASHIGTLFRKTIPSDEYQWLSIWPLISRMQPLGFLVLAQQHPPVDDPDEFKSLLHRYTVSQIAMTMHGHLIQEKLERTRRFLQSILDSAGDAIMVINRDNRIKVWNPAAERMYGYSREEIIDNPLTDFTQSASRRQKAMDTIDHVRQRLDSDILEAEHASRDGRKFHVRLTISPIVSRTGEYLGITNISTDITAQINLQEDLQRQSDRLAAILDVVHDCVIMHDLNRKVVVINRRFEEIFGVKREDAIDKSLDHIIEDVRANGFIIPDELLKPFRHLSANPELSDEGEVTLERTSREPSITVRWYSTPVRSSDGELLGRIYALSDITKERQSEQAKARFLSLVSHELRNPLSTIKGFAELILRGGCGPINEEIRESLQMIILGTDRLANVIDDMLTLTQKETSRLELSTGPVNLSGVIEQAVGAIWPFIKEKGHKLTVDIGNLPLISADPKRLLQIVINLLNNACKYTSSGGQIGIRATLCTTREHLPPDAPQQIGLPCVLITVIDNGMGIREEDKPYIFEHFFRSDSALLSGVEGSGLGLAVVRTLVEAHGGHVWFHSERGRGTTFHFTLPVEGKESARSVSH